MELNDVVDFESSKRQAKAPQGGVMARIGRGPLGKALVPLAAVTVMAGAPWFVRAQDNGVQAGPEIKVMEVEKDPWLEYEARKKAVTEHIRKIKRTWAKTFGRQVLQEVEEARRILAAKKPANSHIAKAIASHLKEIEENALKEISTADSDESVKAIENGELNPSWAEWKLTQECGVYMINPRISQNVDGVQKAKVWVIMTLGRYAEDEGWEDAKLLNTVG